MEAVMNPVIENPVPFDSMLAAIFEVVVTYTILPVLIFSIVMLTVYVALRMIRRRIIRNLYTSYKNARIMRRQRLHDFYGKTLASKDTYQQIKTVGAIASIARTIQFLFR
jgi:hypothetical protein